jgi:hypothetical protein
MSEQFWSWIEEGRTLISDQLTQLSAVMELQRMLLSTTTNQRLAYLAHRLDIFDTKDASSCNRSIFILKMMTTK